MRWDDHTGRPLDPSAWATSIGAVSLLLLGPCVAQLIIYILGV
jgi:hypothetical protein